MDLNQETLYLSKKIGNDLSTWQAIFEQLGLETRPAGNKRGFYIDCPNCGEKHGERFKVHVRVEDSNFGYVNWRCYHCDCQKDWYSSYVGLFRLIWSKQGDEVTPRDALSRINDEIYVPLRQKRGELIREDLTMPKGKYEGKSIDVVPISYLSWAVEKLPWNNKEKARAEATKLLVAESQFLAV